MFTCVSECSGMAPPSVSSRSRSFTVVWPPPRDGTGTRPSEASEESGSECRSQSVVGKWIGESCAEGEAAQGGKKGGTLPLMSIALRMRTRKALSPMSGRGMRLTVSDEVSTTAEIFCAEISSPPQINK